MTGSLLIVQRFIREDIMNAPNVLVAFGDNLARRGLGGQAKECRGCPNAVGIITKRYPGRQEEHYLNDDDFEEVAPLINEAFDKLKRHILEGHDVAIPNDGIGTGLAQLATRAPSIRRLVIARMTELLASAESSHYMLRLSHQAT